MAEKIVFDADIDNVTIKNVDGVLTAVVNVEDAEEEFEVVTDYVEPQEDDDYYIEPVFAKFRHKATQFLTDAFKKEKKPRSAPVNESLARPVTANITVQSDTIKIVPADTRYPSTIDGHSVDSYSLSGFDQEFSKSDYPNAKVFNEAHAGKTFTVTTAKRYAESEGHPIVKPTEIQVVCPTIFYVEDTYAPRVEQVSYALEYESYTFDGTAESDLIGELLRINESTEHEVSYVVRYPDGEEISGTYTYTGNYLVRPNVPGYRNEASSYERWDFKPYVVENFNGKLTISPQSYIKGTS